MAWYRFPEPARQTDFVEFGLAIGFVCGHLKTWGIGITDIRLRTNKLAFDTSAPLTADQIAHLELEAG